MNSKQYERMMKEVFSNACANSGVAEEDVVGANLEAHRTYYTIKLKDGTEKVIDSGLEWCPD